MFGKKQNKRKTAIDTREWYFERERLTVNFQPPAGMINLESTIVSAFTGYSIVSSNVSMTLCFVSFFSEGCNRFLKTKLSAWHWWQANCKVSLSWKQRSVAIWLSMNVHPWRAFYFFQTVFHWIPSVFWNLKRVFAAYLQSERIKKELNYKREKRSKNIALQKI